MSQFMYWYAQVMFIFISVFALMLFLTWVGFTAIRLMIGEVGIKKSYRMMNPDKDKE